jgi:PAS domain S-box-containing protein
MDTSKLEKRIKELELELIHMKSDLVTEKQITKSLNQSLDIFRIIFEKASDGIFIMNIDKELIFVNESFAQMHGYTPEEMKDIGLDCLDDFTETIQDHGERMKRILNGETLRFEVNHHHKSGKTIVLEVVSNLVPFQNEKFIVAFHRDITQNKEAELVYRENEVKYKFIVENIGEGFGFVNTNEEFVVANPAAERIFGVGKGELTGKNLKDFLSKEQYFNILNQTKIRKEGKTSNYEFELTRFDGNIRNIHITAVPQFDEKNLFLGTHGIFRDITEAKQIQDALADEKRRLSNIIEGTNAGTWEWNIQTGETKFNERWAEAIGYSLEELSPVSIDTWIKNAHPEDLKISGELLEKHFKRELGYYECEVRMKHKNGKWVWILDRGKVHTWDRDGKPLLMSGTHQDITHRKESELIISQQNDSLTKLNVDKDLFMSILAHDLKSPFSGLVGLSAVLAENVRKYDIDKIEKFAKSISKSANSTFSLLEDLLLWVRSQSGKMSFAPELLIFQDTCHDMFSVLEPLAHEKNINIKWKSEGQINIFADQEMLKTILRNLVSNAIKYSFKNSEIIVSAEKKPGKITISVMDKGIGIMPDILAGLFDISLMQSSRGTAGEKGTGLGLLLCKEFVSRHGGTIWVESEFGMGSTFRFTLPFPRTYENSMFLANS